MYVPMSSSHLVNATTSKRSFTPASAPQRPFAKLSRSRSVHSSASRGADDKGSDDKRPLLNKFWRGPASKSRSISTRNPSDIPLFAEENKAAEENGNAAKNPPRVSSGNESLERTFVDAEPSARLNPALEIFKTHFNDERIAVFIDLLARDRPDLKHELEIMMILLDKDGQLHLAAGNPDTPGDSRSKEQVIVDLLTELRKHKEMIAEHKKTIANKNAEVRAERERCLEFKALMVEHSDLVRAYQTQKADRTKHLTALNKTISDMQKVSAVFHANVPPPNSAAAQVRILTDAPKYLDELIILTRQMKYANLQFYNRYFPGEDLEDLGAFSQSATGVSEVNGRRVTPANSPSEDSSAREYFDANDQPGFRYNFAGATVQDVLQSNSFHRPGSAGINGRRGRGPHDGQNGRPVQREIYELEGTPVEPPKYAESQANTAGGPGVNGTTTVPFREGGFTDWLQSKPETESDEDGKDESSIYEPSLSAFPVPPKSPTPESTRNIDRRLTR